MPNFSRLKQLREKAKDQKARVHAVWPADDGMTGAVTSGGAVPRYG